MALTTIPSELSSVSGISDSSTSTAITIDSSQNVSFAGTITATAATQAASDNSTKLATTAYVTTALANLVDSAPGTLNTLNELAAALGDDANFSTTVTNSIATKLPLTGGTLTGGLTTTALAVNSGGSTSDISGTAIFRIMGSDVRITNASGSEAMATFAADGAVSLFHDASTKLATTSTGITVTGTLNGITTTQSASGTRWGVLPEIAANGVMEIGRYLDFHATSGDTSDYGARFDYDGSKMILTSAMQIEGATTLNNNVSIGTVNTARKLNIKSGTRNATTLAIEDASSTEEVVRIGQQGDGDGFFQLRNTSGAGTILLDASGINYISGGNVGIGTSNPGAVRLNVQTAANGNLAGEFVNTHATGSYGLKIRAGSSSSNYSFAIADKDNATTHFYFRGDGNLGIGTTSPIAALDVQRDSDHQMFVRSVAGNNVTRKGGIAALSYTGNQMGFVHYYSDAGTNYQSYGPNLGSSSYRGPTQHRFYVASGPDTTTHYEKMRLDTGGLIIGSANVGGTTSADIELINDSSGTFAFRRNDTNIVNSEVLGQHYYSGDDPSATKTTHIDRVSATGTWASNYYPSKRAFWFDQGGNLLETFQFYRTQDYGHAVQQLQAGTSASASLRLANDSVNWQVDCRTDDHFAIYNATNARTNLFASRAGTHLGFGTTSARSDIQCTSGTAGAVLWGFGGGISSGNTTYYVINQSNVGVYMASGGQAWVAHSDERIKENITNVGTVLPSLMNMRCVKYNLKSNPANTKIGFIAQDWESAFPEVVDEEPHLVLESDGTIGTEEESESTTPVKAMAYTETIPLLLKAIQEQQALIEALQTEVAALKGE